MENLKLYMMLLGCKPAGRNTEQHDVFFSIGRQVKDIVPELVEFWPEASQKIHLDAWREVTQVGEFDIKIAKKEGGVQPTGSVTAKLFFINLGGYKAGEFEEFHYKMLVASKNKGDAIQEAARTAFYQHTGFKGASSHVDDKYGIDVDDLYEITDILPPGIKDKYIVVLTPCTVRKQDEVHLGYMKLEKL